MSVHHDIIRLHPQVILKPRLSFSSDNDGACSLLLDYPSLFNEQGAESSPQRSTQVWSALGPIKASQRETLPFTPGSFEINAKLGECFAKSWAGLDFLHVVRKEVAEQNERLAPPGTGISHNARPEWS